MTLAGLLRRGSKGLIARAREGRKPSSPHFSPTRLALLTLLRQGGFAHLSEGDDLLYVVCVRCIYTIREIYCYTKITRYTPYFQNHHKIWGDIEGVFVYAALTLGGKAISRARAQRPIASLAINARSTRNRSNAFTHDAIDGTDHATRI
jgi:hypothetical protein